MQRETKDIETMINRYEALKLRMNSFSVSAPLRLKAAAHEEINIIRAGLVLEGYELDCFERWV